MTETSRIATMHDIQYNKARSFAEINQADDRMLQNISKHKKDDYFFNYAPAYVGIKFKKFLNNWLPSVSEKIAPFGQSMNNWQQKQIDNTYEYL